MKKLILASLIALPALSIAQQNYTVTVKVKNINPAARAFMYYQLYGKLKRDSAVLTNHQFVFRGAVDDPLKAFVMLSHKGNSINSTPNPDQVGVYLENGEVVVNTTDSLKYATVAGTPLNNDQQLLVNLQAPFKQKTENLTRNFDKAADNQKEQIRKQFATLEKERKEMEENFIRTHAQSIVAFNLFRSTVDPAKERERALALFNLFPESLQNTNAGLIMKSYFTQAKAVDVGSDAPMFTAKNTKGTDISLSSFKGKYVLIDFWASWCVPCRRENPNVVAAYEKYKDKNFTVLGVSLDDGENAKQKWIDAINKDGLKWEQVSDLAGWQSAIARMYSVSAIPANFLVDPNGKIIARDLRGDALQQKLSSVL